MIHQNQQSGDLQESVTGPGRVAPRKKLILNRHHAFLLIDLLKDRIREYCTGPIEPAGEYPNGSFLINQIEVRVTPIYAKVPKSPPLKGVPKPGGGGGCPSGQPLSMDLPVNLLTKNLGQRYNLQYLPGKNGIRFRYMGVPAVIHFNQKPRGGGE